MARFVQMVFVLFGCFFLGCFSVTNKKLHFSGQQKEYNYYIGPEMILTKAQLSAMKSRTTVENFVVLWPNGVVPYVFDKITINADQITTLNEAMEMYKNKTCIRFIPRTTEPNYVNIVGGEGWDCSAYVGVISSIKNGQKLTFKSDCTVAAALHEFGHTIGFMHEHQRYDRDEYIRVDLSKVDGGAYWLAQYTKVPLSGVTANSAKTVYDYTSMMHYHGWVGEERSIITLDPAYQDVIGQDEGFGKCDVTKINYLYNCGAQYERLPECFKQSP